MFWVGGDGSYICDRWGIEWSAWTFWGRYTLFLQVFHLFYTPLVLPVQDGFSPLYPYSYFRYH